MIKTAVSSEIWAKIPMRSSNTSKSDYGKVLCVCGSPAYRGAAALCCMGALRAGAGLVTLAANENVIASIAQRILEAT
ncbi:MAG: NAD(P)H-hydrate dehydratase, partial [Oscillospiraceae bacterium]